MDNDFIDAVVGHSEKNISKHWVKDKSKQCHSQILKKRKKIKKIGCL